MPAFLNFMTPKLENVLSTYKLNPDTQMVNEVSNDEDDRMTALS